MSNDNDIAGEDNTLGERGSPALPPVSTALVVEDDDDMREVLALLLADEGYSVMTAPHGAAALALLDEVEPDVMILDLMMPVMTGWDVLAALETTGRADDLAMVVFSSSDFGTNPRGLPVVDKSACVTTLIDVVNGACAVHSEKRHAQCIFSLDWGSTQGSQAAEDDMASKERGFAAMDEAKQREIASKGGKASHEKGTAHEFTPEEAARAGRKAHEEGTAHEFTSEEAAEAGRKGGEVVSRDRKHMAAIGKKGGEARGEARRAQRKSEPEPPPSEGEAQEGGQ